MQTLCLNHVFWQLETCWNAYLYDWVWLNLYFAYFEDGDYLTICFTYLHFVIFCKLGVYFVISDH